MQSSPHRKAKQYLYIVFSVFITLNIFSQSTLPEISPEGDLLYSTPPQDALFSYSINNTNLDFFLLGMLDSNLGFKTAIRWIPLSDGGYKREVVFQPSAISISFMNTVDLVTSIWINNKFFFKSSFRAGFTDNSIILGYYGGGALKELKFGNSNINVQSYPFLQNTPGNSKSPGISATFVSKSTVHEFMLRYEASNEVIRSFIGNSEYRTQEIGVQDFIPGKYFLLPDSNPEQLRVWIETADESIGSERVIDSKGFQYRLLRPETDYGFIQGLGELTINPAIPRGRILIHYFIDGKSVSDHSHIGDIAVAKLQAGNGTVGRDSVAFSLAPGSDFENNFVIPLNNILGFSEAAPGIRLSQYSREIEGLQTLVLYEPGVFSPFEIQAYYSVDDYVEEIELQKVGGSIYSVPFRNYGGLVQLSTTNSIQATIEPWKLRYPLLDILNSDELHINQTLSIYGPRPETDFSVISPLTLQMKAKIGEGIRIREEIIPGSLIVYRNSVITSDVSVVNGLLVFSSPLGALDTITLVYRVPDYSGQIGNINAITGHRIFLPNNDEISLALSGMIGTLQKDKKRFFGDNSAHIQLSGAYNLNQPEIKVGIEGVVKYSATDSDNTFSPSSSASDSTALSITEASLLPSPPPETTQLQAFESLPESVRNIVSRLNSANRGIQHYKNFRIDGVVTSRDRYEKNSEPPIITQAIGPYPVLPGSNDDIEGLLATLEFETSSGEWVGYQVANALKVTGFINGFTLSVLPEYLDQEVHIFLQAGLLGEDLNSNFQIDEQTTPNEKGIPFTYNGNDTIYAGYPGRAYYDGWEGLTEDINGNGILENDSLPSMISLYLGSLEHSDVGNWQELEYNFTPTEVNRLRELTALRVIVVSENSSHGRIFFGNQKIKRSSTVVLGTNSTIQQINGNPPHYKLEWKDASQSDSTVEMRLPLADTPYGIYKKLRLDLNAGELSEEETVQINVNGQVLGSIRLKPQDIWKTLEIDFDEQTINLIHGKQQESSQGFPSFFKSELVEYIGLKLFPSDLGILLVREPTFFDGYELFAGGGKTSLNWTPASASIMTGSIFQTSLRSLKINASAFSKNFNEEGGVTLDVGINGSIPFFLAALYFHVYWDFEDKLHVNARHDLSFNVIQGFKLRDSFSQQWQGSNTRIDKIFELRINPINWLFFSSDYLLSSFGEHQNRNWNFNLQLGSKLFFNTWFNLVINEKGIDFSNESYSQNYVRSFTSMNWNLVEGESFLRNTTLGISLGLNSDAISIHLSAQNLNTYHSRPNLVQTFIQEIDIDIYPDENLNIEINSTQNFSHQDSALVDNLVEQLGILFAYANYEPHFILPFFVIGFFSDVSVDAFFNSAGDRNFFTNPRNSNLKYDTDISFSRSLLRNAYDLLIPFKIEIGLQRELKWEQGITNDKRYIDSYIRWQAVNIFGRLGTNPLFSGYESDEFYMDIQYRHNFDQTNDWEIGGQFSPSFFNIGSLESLGHVFNWQWSSKGRSAFSCKISTTLHWISPIKVNITSPLVQSGDTTRNFELKHHETIVLRYSSLRNESPKRNSPITPADFTLGLIHESILPLSNVGRFSIRGVGEYMINSLEFFKNASIHQLNFELHFLLNISY